MRSTLLAAALVVSTLVAHAEPAPSARDQLLKRAHTALEAIRKGGKVWTGKVKEVPDYGFQADNFALDGDGDEGTIYLQFPGKYRIRWSENNEAYCYDGQQIHQWASDGERATLALNETAFGALVQGTLDGTNRVGAITQEELRFEGKKQPIIFLDLEPAQNANRSNSVRVYITGSGEARIVGFRIPAERRSGYGNPDYFNFWLRDLHPEMLDNSVFKPH